jgi:hypothetical protein
MLGSAWNHRLSVLALGGVLGLLAFSSTTAGAPPTRDPAIAEVHYSASEVYFEPRVRASAWTLTVTGPNGFVLQRWNQGSPPSISLFDDEGQPLVDGSYSYHLQAEISLPRSATEDSSRETPDGRDTTLRPGVRLPELPAASGHFRIAGGAIVTPGLAEPQGRARSTRTAPQGPGATPEGVASQPLQIIGQDLSVQGSLCVGTDCTSSESFGFDTIRLKENNLRLRVQDTSSTSLFPTRDWQLTFNESDNGGLDKFSIDDIDSGRSPFTLEGNAPNNALYIDDAGNLGMGTNAPVVEMHVADGDTPTLRLEQNGSSGFVPQTWDVAGNETNFFVRDVTHGSTLPIKLKPGAPTSSIYIQNDGRVGLGDESPAAPLDVKGTASTIGVGNAALKLVNTAGPVALQLDPSDNGVFWNFGVPDDDTFRISRSATGGAELELTSDGDLTLRGDLTINGTCMGCDGLFQPDYPLESLEEHAAFMRENSFLPEVGPTPDGRTAMRVFEKTAGILKELEKAHIYIAQLNETLKKRDAEVADLRERLTRLEALLAKE